MTVSKASAVVPTSVFAVLLILLLIMPYVALLPAASAQASKKIVIDVSHGQVGRTRRTGVFANVQGNLTSWGYEFVEAKGGINSTVLTGAGMLLLGSVFQKNFTESEVQAIVEWFNQGEKAIWVGSDSDFGNGTYIIDNANRVLEALGSKIRAEPTQVLDPVSNAAADYRVVANVVNQDPDVADITAGVSKILFHGPTILAGVQGNAWVALETTELENVYWVLKTSPDSIIVDTDLVPPKAHTNGAKGSFVVMAVEKFAGARSSSKIIVSGSDAYGDYEPVFQWAYYGVALDGPALVRHSIGWALKAESPPTFLDLYSTWIMVAIAIIIVLAGAALYLRRRKK